MVKVKAQKGDKIKINSEEEIIYAKCTGITHENIVHFIYHTEDGCPMAGMVGSDYVEKVDEDLELKKGVDVIFKANYGEVPDKFNTARVVRVAKDKSWIDVTSFWGRKRVPNNGDNFKVLNVEIIR